MKGLGGPSTLQFELSCCLRVSALSFSGFRVRIYGLGCRLGLSTKDQEHCHTNLARGSLAMLVSNAQAYIVNESRALRHSLPKYFEDVKRIMLP